MSDVAADPTPDPPPDLPVFRYHPDPVATGAIIPSDGACLCCGQARGALYVGPVYAIGEYGERLCPWCIADGSASATFDATFTDDAGIGGGDWDEVSDAVISEVSSRTPGFSGWQQERWWTHCGDAGAFLGRMGRAELLALGEEAVAAIRDSTGLDGARWDRHFRALQKDGSPTAYLFRCLRCGALGGYQDSH